VVFKILQRVWESSEVKIDDITFESMYGVPVTNNAHQACPYADLQANWAPDLSIVIRDDGRGALPNAPALPHIPSAPPVNIYAHSSAPYAMNALALQTEATILAQGSAWQWIPDTRIGHRGRTGIVVEQAPEIDPWTQSIAPEVREGYRGVFPYDRFTKIPFPNAWE
jgi:hypothetical protein